MRSKLCWLIAVSLSILIGCGARIPHYIYKSNPEVSMASNAYFDASITPTISIGGYYGYYGIESFILTINNKTEKPIELNWNKTLYMRHDQTDGRFYTEGTVFSKRTEDKPNDIVFPKTTFKKQVWPNILTSLSGTWMTAFMDPGQNGLYLTMIVDGKEVTEKLSVTIIAVAPNK